MPNEFDSTMKHGVDHYTRTCTCCEAVAGYLDLAPSMACWTLALRLRRHAWRPSDVFDTQIKALLLLVVGDRGDYVRPWT